MRGDWKLIDNIKKTCKSYVGKTALIKYLEGKYINPRQSIRAYCYECAGYYEDGKFDCKNGHVCPLYPFNPYGSDPAPRQDKGKHRLGQKTSPAAVKKSGAYMVGHNG